MSQMTGANIGDLRQLATAFDAAAKKLDGDRTTVRNALYRTPWRGPSAERFRTAWDRQHQRNVAELATVLREEARNLRRQADEQQDASNRGASASNSGRSRMISTKAWDNTVKFGVGGRGVEGARIEKIKMSDGTYIVRVQYSSSFEASAADGLNLASLAAPQSVALGKVAGLLGVSLNMFGVSRGWDLRVSDEAGADRLIAGLQREANEVAGADALSREEIEQEIKRELERGSKIGVLSSFRTNHGDQLSGDLGAGPFKLAAESSLSSITHETNNDDETVRDSLRTVALTSETKAGVLSTEAAVSQEITIVRDKTGTVVGIEVVTSAGAGGGGDLSSNDVAALAGGAGPIGHFLNAGGSASNGLLTQTTKTYDLTTPAGQALALSLGCREGEMSGAEILSVQRAADAAGVGGEVETSVYRSSETSRSMRLISHDRTTTDSALEYVGSASSRF